MDSDYMAFVLGYDLLHDYLKDMECDRAWEYCKKVYQDFLGSEYNNELVNEYDCLYEYVEEMILNKG